jgi:vitamin B12 transporter
MCFFKTPVNTYSYFHERDYMQRKSIICEARTPHLSFFKTLFLLGSILFIPAFVSAQTEEEMKMLRMYFKADELVISSTRTLKPLSQVAENMSVVNAEEIEAMNAHTLIEVLERVTGIYVYYMINDFYKDAFLFIDGAVSGDNVNKEERHVLILLDGIPWNFMSNGKPIIDTIPVNIIKRLEIIKGPASSVWGSSLGGVINIVTKDAGDTTIPSGTVSASFGEERTRDYNGAVSGRAGTAGYYLYAGKQHSDGFEANRYFERTSFYGKLDVPLTSDIRLMLTAGHSKPSFNEGDDVDNDFTIPVENSAFHTTATLTAALTDALYLEASLYNLKQKYVFEYESLSTDGLLYRWAGDERKTGGSAKLLFMQGVHNAVLGWDINRTGLDKTEKGEWMMGETVRVHPRIDKWAVFINDTISIGSLSITPGIRYDKDNIAVDFTSPSLGVTYRLDDRTVLRASAARGFSIVPLLYTEGETYSNPDLEPEEIWSYQAGVESVITEYLHLKAVVFHHNMKDAIILTDTFINAGKTRRTGTDLEVETSPFHDVSLKAGVSYFRKKFIFEDETFTDIDTAKDIYSYHLVVNYDDRKSLSAQLAGNFTWWDLPASDGAKYDTFIWDFNLIKNIYSTDKLNTEVFLTAHNIFNGSYYVIPDRENPRRWMEGGVRVKF